MVVHVYGGGFIDRQDLLRCAFDFGTGSPSISTSVEAVLVSENHVECVVPPSVDGAARAVAVRVTADGYHWSVPVAGATFRYVNPVFLTGLSPNAGPEHGGTVVSVLGSGFARTTAYTCTFGDAEPTAAVFYSTEALSCIAPSASGMGNVSVSIAVNGYKVSSASASANVNTYAYYGTPTVTRIEPSSGALSGSTVVTVYGSGLNAGLDRAWCRFGDVVVLASSVSPTALMCSSPPWQPSYLHSARSATYGAVPLSVSLNGADYTSTSQLDHVLFTYNDFVVVNSLSPSTGPISGGTVLTLSGTMFPVTQGMRCRFGNASATDNSVADSDTFAYVASSTTATCTTPVAVESGRTELLLTLVSGELVQTGVAFTYHDPVTISTVSPAMIGEAGGDVVTVSGANFADNGALACNFGTSHLVRALWQSSALCTCQAPSLPLGFVAVSVTTNGVDFSDDVVLSVVQKLTVLSVDPEVAPLVGGTIVTVMGTGFAGADSILCEFDGLASVAKVLSPTMLTCEAPPSITGMASKVALGLAQTSVATGEAAMSTMAMASRPFFYHPLMSVEAVEPTLGPSAGGTVVTLEGLADALDSWVTGLSGASASETPAFGVTCRFGNVTVAGHAHGSDYHCKSPAASFQSSMSQSSMSYSTVPIAVSINGFDYVNIGVGFTYHDDFEVTAVAPASVPDEGGATVIVFGSGFISAATGQLSCRFGDAEPVPATLLASTALACTTPKHAPGFATVSVSANLRDWTTSSVAVQVLQAAAVMAIEPVYAATDGGSVLTLTGSSFIDAPRLQVRLSPSADGEGEGDLVDATFVNENTVVFTAPFRNVPYIADAADSSVRARVSTRLVADGVDFTDRAASFDYLPAFSATTVYPNTGSVRGGTPAIVIGEGFDPAFAYSCRFETGAGSSPKNVGAMLLNASALACEVPPHSLYASAADAPKFPGGSVTVKVARAADGAVSTLGPSFFYLPDIRLDSVYPTTIPARGGILVQLTGQSFPRTDALKCRFGTSKQASTSEPNAAYGEESAAAQSTASSDDVVVSGVWRSPTQLDCRAPHLPPSLREVAVTSNGVDWTGGVYLTFEPDRTIVGMEPLAGPPEGGTLVSVQGTGFRAGGGGSSSPVALDPANLLSPFCRFGTVEVNAVVVSDVEIACRSPAYNNAFKSEGPVNVTVAMRYPYVKRRVNFEMSTGLVFTYQVVPTTIGLAPKTAPASGGTELDVSGANFQDSSALVVRFVDLGSGQSVSAAPTFVSQTALFVVAPPSPSGLSGGFVAVEVSNNGQDFSRDEVLLFYDEAVGVNSVYPTTIPETGGAILTVSGTNFVQSFPSVLACRIGGEAVTAATWISSTRLQCYAPPMAAIAPGGAPHASVEVTINGFDYTSDRISVEYRPAISLLSLEPGTGPRRGSTAVTITGNGFRATDTSLVCRFAGAKVAATVLSEYAITCPAPALALGASRRVPVEVAMDGEAETTRSVEFLVDRHAEHGFTGLAFQYYLDEDVAQLSPKSGSMMGGTVIKVKGTNFLDTPGLSCRFRSQAAADASLRSTAGHVGLEQVTVAASDTDPWSVVVSALYDGPSDLRCVAPPQTVAGGEEVEVAVSNNGVDYNTGPLGVLFLYAEPVVLLSLTPAAGPDAGNTTVTIEGGYFVPSPDLACKFGGDGGATSPARFVSKTIITCKTPPAQPQATGAVIVSVTTNGVDFTRANESLHYEYRSAASVYTVLPASGCVSGGTRVIVSGSNFQEVHAGDGGLHCRFGAVSVPAKLVSSVELVCVAPPHNQGIVSVEVTNNQVARAGNSSVAAWTTAAAAGTQWTHDGLSFRYTPAARVSTVSPSAGSVSGGTVLRVMGSDFLDSAPVRGATLITCKIVHC